LRVCSFREWEKGPPRASRGIPGSPDGFGADGSPWPSTPDKGLSLDIEKEEGRFQT